MPDDRVADRVSADMERIFRRHTPSAATVADERAAGGRSRDFVVHALPAAAAPSRLVRLVTIVIPLLAIAVVAFLFVRIGMDGRPSAAIAQASPTTRPAPATSAPARPAPVAYQAVAPVAVDAVADGVADGARIEDNVATPRDDRPSTTPVAPARRLRTAVPTAPAVSVARAPVAVDDRGCRPGSEENHCIYRDVREADRRLVAAYRAAADAGVPRREMLAVRRLWTRALAVSLDDPDGTIRTYDDLARRLREAARTMQADDGRT